MTSKSEIADARISILTGFEEDYRSQAGVFMNINMKLLEFN